MTSYAAKGGIEAYVFMPKDAPEANRIEVEMTGGELTLIDGLISDAGVLSRERAAREGLFDVSTLQEPYRVEGQEDDGLRNRRTTGVGRCRTRFIYPTGGGTGIVGMWKAFAEMEAMGWIGSERSANVRGAVGGMRADGPRLRARGTNSPNRGRTRRLWRRVSESRPALATTSY